MREFIVEADGGSRGNPGPAGYGAVVIDAATGQTLAEAAEYIGIATNNVAEYRGLLAGLRAAHDLDPTAAVHVRMDSKLVIEQMSGRWKIKHPDMKPLAFEAARVFPATRMTYEWIPREQNKHADRLANEAMDAGKRGEQWSAATSAAELHAAAAASGTATARTAIPPEPSGPPGDATAGAARARAALTEARSGPSAPSATSHAPAAASPSSAAAATPASRAAAAASPSAAAWPGASAAEGRSGAAAAVAASHAPAAASSSGAAAASPASRAAAVASPSAAAWPGASAAEGRSGAAAAVAASHAPAAASSSGAAAAAPASDAAAASPASHAAAVPGASAAPAPPRDAAQAGEGTPARGAAPAAEAAPSASTVSPKADADVRAARTVASPGWAPADMGAPATFVLLRHGETPLTPQKRFSGSGGTDPSLSDVGREQAERVGAALARRGTIQAIVASPLTRTRETAGIVARHLGLDVSIDDELRETDFGAWEGLTFAEVRERFPDDLNAWLADPEARPSGGGESFAATATRIAAARDKLVAAYAGRTVLLVSHVTPIKTFVRLALGAPPESLFRMELSAASLSAVAYYADGNASVRLFNDTSHLR